MGAKSFVLEANRQVGRGHAVAHNGHNSNLKERGYSSVSLKKAAYQQRVEQKAYERLKKESRKGELKEYLFSASLAMLVIFVVVAISLI